MSKRQRAGYTLLNSKNKQEEIEAKISHMLQKVWHFSFQTAGNHKSNAKTDELHEKWEKIIYSSFGDYEDRYRDFFQLHTEKAKLCGTTNKIADIQDMYEQKFNVDLLMKKGEAVNTVFLLKAPLTSINKNRYNYIGNLMGEVCRFYGNEENLNTELVFVNFIPKQNFVIDSDNCRKETTRFLSFTGAEVLKKAPITERVKSLIHEINIEYDLRLPFDMIKNKEDLKNVINVYQSQEEKFVSVEDISSLKVYLENFIKKYNKELDIDLNFSSKIPVTSLNDLTLFMKSRV